MLQTLLERRADEVMETYVGWKEACSALQRAYAAWHAAPRHDRRLACAAHVAALDREQHAALVYACAIERLTRPQPPLAQARSLAS